MRSFVACALILLSPPTLALSTLEWCMMANPNADYLRHLAEATTHMRAPDVHRTRAYACSLVPGFGCFTANQEQVPVTLTAGAAATLDLTEGFPSMNRRWHLFHMHSPLELTADGALLDVKTKHVRGFAGEEANLLYVIITDPFAGRVTATDHPALIDHDADGRLRRVMRAYACELSGR